MKIPKFTITTFIAFALVACNNDDDVTPFQELSEDQKTDFNAYISGLNFDADAILEIQDIEGQTSREELSATSSESGDDKEFVACETKDYSLKQNFEEVAILRPTDGIVWPGAIVKANKNLLEGVPDPVGLARAPITLSVDLPGIGENGVFEVENPANSSVQVGIDNALDWWNENAFQEGYVNASNSSFRTTVSYSFQQLALDLGLNVKWIGGEASSQFNLTSSSERKVTMLTFKQVFYKVTYDTPPSPAEVFSGTVSQEDLENTFDDSAVPAYIHSVSYGRIISFRMETSSSVTDAELKAAIEFTSSGKRFDAELEAKYQQILNESTVDVFIIGGNAEVASLATQSNDLEALGSIITGENAVYSKSNPGVPIAYSVRFLSDNSLAKLGYSTEYTAEDCQVFREGYVEVDHNGAYVATFSVNYSQNGQPVSKSSGDFTAGFSKRIDLPANATDVKIKAEAYTGLFWDPRNTIFEKDFQYNPGNRCYNIRGTTLSPNSEEEDCG